VLDPQGRILLVLRGHEPFAGHWSLPSGRCEPGEDAAAAAAREVLEETGLAVEVGDLLGVLRRQDAAGRYHYEVHDFACRPVAGALHAGDDAADARWFDVDELPGLDLSPGLLDALRDFGVAPPARAPARGG
jgi:ADP-ribose pyrophosphatase YjhB (NUDIX family)